MGENRERPKKKHTTLWVVLLVMLPVLYVLSVGPAVWITRGIPAHRLKSIDDFYQPVVWISARNQWFDDALEFHLNFWETL